MAMANSEKRTRSDKFPLTLHRTGQYCKKIRGNFCYFGTDKEHALQRYIEEATYLHTGKGKKPEAVEDAVLLKTFCNLYLGHQQTRAAIGEVKLRHVSDQTLILRSLVKFVGPNRLVSDVSTIDLQSYRQRLIKAGRTSHTINNHISTIKATFNWAFENEIVQTAPNLKAIKKIAHAKNEKPTFTAAQIRMLLQNAGPQMKAMIWLGLNCGFGCTDCAELKWGNLDMENRRVRLPRGKTGVNRNLPLWPETVEALLQVPRQGELVFYTHKGNPWVRTIRSIMKDGTEKYTKDDAVTQEFSKLMKKAGIEAPKGVGFYTLRRTAATVAANAGDPFAVQKLLGHADVKMASTYVQNISEQTDRVINNSRKVMVEGSL
jgi:integrase